MWYDATSAAGSLEADDSPVKGKIGYAPAPVVETDSSGWLYAWSWGIQAASKKQDAAWKFISWAVGQGVRAAGRRRSSAGRSVPAGKRSSTYENPEYLAEAAAFAEPTQAAIENADPTQPRRAAAAGVGIQFVGIPEFPDLGTQVSQEVSSAIAGQITVDDALNKGQELAEDVGEVQAVTEPSRKECVMSTAVGAHGPARGATQPHRRETPGAGTRPGLGPACPAAARADLPDHRDPAAVRGHADHLVHELERLLPRRARVRRVRQLRHGPHRPQHARRDHHHDRADRVGGADQPGARPAHRAAAGPDVPRPRRRPDDDDHTVPVVPVAAALVWKHALYNPEYGCSTAC